MNIFNNQSLQELEMQKSNGSNGLEANWQNFGANLPITNNYMKSVSAENVMAPESGKVIALNL